MTGVTVGSVLLGIVRYCSVMAINGDIGVWIQCGAVFAALGLPFQATFLLAAEKVSGTFFRVIREIRGPFTVYFESRTA